MGSDTEEDKDEATTLAQAEYPSTLDWAAKGYAGAVRN